jgi:Flp pilus assembly protein TadG
MEYRDDPDGAARRLPDLPRDVGAFALGRRLASQGGAWPGQAVVEFALVSLVVLLLVCGTLDLGRGVFARAMLTNAVREAARTGSLAPNDLTALRTAAARRSPGLGLTPTSGVITATCYHWNTASGSWGLLSGTGDCGATQSGALVVQSGDRLVVQATYTFNLTAARLFGFNSIVMQERAQVAVQ